MLLNSRSVLYPFVAMTVDIFLISVVYGLSCMFRQCNGIRAIYVGIKGYTFSEDILSNLTNIKTTLECTVYCSGTVGCVSISYNSKTKTCQLHSRTFCSAGASTLSDDNVYFEVKKEEKRRCEDIQLMTKIGIYDVQTVSGSSRLNYCYCSSDKYVYNVFQNRFDGSQSFYKTWNEYQNGFGTLNGEFWLGNDEIHRLTSDNSSMLKIEMMDFNGVKKFSEYRFFVVANESNNYQLKIGQYSGTAGDSFIEHHNGMYFTTKDRDNDIHITQNCAVLWQGGYWYSGCFENNLNGMYRGDVKGTENSMSWPRFHTPIQHFNLKTCKMMIRLK